MHRSRAMAAIAALITFAGMLSLSTPAEAGNRGKNPILRQLTNLTTGQIYSIRLKSERAETIHFVADGDVLGPGTEHLGDREIYTWHKDTGSITKLTETAGGESYDVSRETDITHTSRPKFTALISTGDLDPTADNSDGNPELFIHMSDTGVFRQITNTTAGQVNAEPYPSDSGRCIAFRSTADLDTNDGSDSKEPGAGFGNSDGSDEIFVLRFLDNEMNDFWITQVSDGPANTISSKPVIGGFWFSRQCRSTTYESTHDQLDNGSQGIHVYNYTKTSGRIQQLSPEGLGINTNPAMSSASNFARGPFVVFESNMSPFDNGSEDYELFRFRLFSTEFKQYTNRPVGNSRDAEISDGGGWIAWESDSEILDPNARVHGATTPVNADGNAEIYRSKGRKRAWQITDSTGCNNVDPSLQDNGRGIAFLSDCNHVGGANNAQAVQQLFLYSEHPRGESLLSSANCQTADGCCNVANGCYTRIQGRQVRPEHPR